MPVIITGDDAIEQLQELVLIHAETYCADQEQYALDVITQEIVKLRTERDVARSEAAALKVREAVLVEAIQTIRDNVLRNRQQLAEFEIDNDITNAVLGIIDDETNGLV